jgi:hypothetical protein
MASDFSVREAEHVDRRQSSQVNQVNKMSDSPQRIPQYIEVPPNVEAKRIIPYFSAVLFY